MTKQHKTTRHVHIVKRDICTQYFDCPGGGLETVINISRCENL